MASTSPTGGERDQRLQAILHAYLQAVDAGRHPDSQAIVRRHPEFASELTAFFADQAQVAQLAHDMKPATAAADMPTSGAPTTAVARPPLAVIRYFGDYELLDEIARGGMGVVYKAKQVKLKRIVAVKMILAGELAHSTDVDRFQSEARAAANLHHPNIVAIHEIGEHQGQHYFSMDYIAGESLNNRIARGPLPAREAAMILAKVTQAVSFAHVAGVIHRDLKPANILLDSKGEPHVTDFGLAKRVSGGVVSGESSNPPLTTHHSQLTQTGQVLGTPSYMPPEQAAGRTEEIGPRADVYSLGAVLYCAVTGRPPFQAASTLDTLLQVIDREPAAPRTLNPAVPRDLETICLKCLEKDPARRYASAQELADELTRFLEGRPIVARPVGSGERAWRWCRRNPVVAGLSAAVFVSLVVGIWVSTYLALLAQARAHDAEEHAETAKKETQRAEAESQQAKLERDRADREAEQAQDILSRSLFEQAQALRRTSQPGRRNQSLLLLREAEKLRGRVRKVDVEPAQGFAAGLSAKLPTQLELRNEAVAALLVVDAGLDRELKLGATGSLLAVSMDGRLVAASWMDIDMGKIGKGDMSGSKAGVQIVDLLDDAKSARWQRPLTAMLLSTAVAISPDNRFVVSSSHKLQGPKIAAPQVEFRETQTGKVAKVLDWPTDDKSEPAAPSSTTRCFFSPDGRYLAAAHLGIRQLELALWDLKTGSARILTRDQNPAGNWLLFTSDNKRLAYPSGEKTIALWDLDKSEVAETIELPLPIVHAPVFSANDRLLAAPCKMRTDPKISIIVWDIAKKAEKARFQVRGAGLAGIGLTGLAFRPGTDHLAMGEGPGIIVVDVSDGKEIARLDAKHAIGVAALHWQADGRRLMSSSLDGLLKIWEIADKPPIVSIQPAVESMSSAAFSPDGSLLAVGAAQSLQAWLIEPKTGAVKRTLASTIKATEKAGFHQIHYRSDGKQVAAISVMGKAAVWDVDSGKEIARRNDKGVIQSGAFADDGHFLVTVNLPEKIVVWDVTDDRLHWEKTGIPPYVNSNFLVAKGRQVAEINAPLTFFDKGAWSLWDLRQNKKTGPFTMEGTSTVPVFSPDGEWMATPQFTVDLKKSPERVVDLWQLSTGKNVHAIKSFPASMAFSPDSGVLGIVAWDGVVSMWDARTGGEIMRGAFDARDIAFSPDGKTLALRGIDSVTGGATAKFHMLDLAGLRSQLARLGLDW